MALNYDLSGLTQKTIQLKKGDNPASFILTNVSPDAKLKCELRRKNKSSVTYIDNMPVGLVLESQKKIEALSSARIPVLRPTSDLSNPQYFTVDIPVTAKSYQTHDYTTGMGQPELVALKTAIISLGVNGEITLHEGDILTITLTNLKKHENSSIEFKGGRADAQAIYTFTKNTWEKKDDRLNVDLREVQFLAFNPSDLPDTVEFVINGQLLQHTSDNLQAFSADRFGIVSTHEKEGSIDRVSYGIDNVVLLDVRGATSVMIEKDGRTTDLNYYTLNFK